MYGKSTRFTRKPAQSLTTIGVLRIRLARATIVATVSSLVFSPRITSTSSIRSTGLKKCMPTNRSGCGADSAMRVIEIVEVLLARIASSRITSARLLIDLFLDRLVLGDRLDDHVAIGEDLGRCRRVEQRQHVAPGPAGVARPILIRLMTTSEARLRPSASRASSTSTIAVRMPERACAAAMPGAHQPGSRARRRACTARGLTAGSLTPGSRASRFFMKKMPIRLASDRRAGQLAERLLLGLQPLFQRQVAALADRLRARPAAPGTAPWSCALIAPSATANANMHLVGDQARAAARSCSRRAFHSPLCWRYSISRRPSSTSCSAGTASNAKPSGDGLLRRDGFARRRSSRWPALRPIKRGSRCVPPQPGKEADLDFRQADLRVRRRRDQPLVHRQDQLGPAAQAAAVDQGDRRKRQPADPAEELVTQRRCSPATCSGVA